VLISITMVLSRQWVVLGPVLWTVDHTPFITCRNLLAIYTGTKLSCLVTFINANDADSRRFGPLIPIAV